MNRVVVDQDLRAKLRNLVDQLELCDETGRTLGHFLPADKWFPLVLPSDQCPYSQDELSRFHQETGGRTLAEFWKSLGRT